MTADEFYNELQKLNCPVGYLGFEQQQTQLPFAVYALPNDDDFHADNTSCLSIQNGWLEIYSEAVNFGLQEQARAIFKRLGIPHRKDDEQYIQDEALYYCRFTFQIYFKESEA